MINNKKIVEASEKYAKEIEKTYKKLAKKYKSTTSLCNWVTINPEAAFQDGINWFLKNLWHDAEEEPYSNLSPILLDGIDREGRQIIKTSFFRSGYWNKTVEYYGIIRWLYIEDLFPETEEEEEEEEYD